MPSKSEKRPKTKKRRTTSKYAKRVAGERVHKPARSRNDGDCCGHSNEESRAREALIAKVITQVHLLSTEQLVDILPVLVLAGPRVPPPPFELM